MSVAFESGNMFDRPFDGLVNPVNCVGVMGAGVAWQFKVRFPGNFDVYKLFCDQGLMKPGSVFPYKTDLDSPKYIFNLPTKQHWRFKSSLEDIEAGLADLASILPSLKLSTLAVPALGCGLGGLNWSDVKPKIERYLGNIDGLAVTVYNPM